MNPDPTNTILRKLVTMVLSALLVNVLCAATAPAPKASQMRDAAKQEDLILKFRAAEQDDPMRHMVVSNLEDPSKVNQPMSLIATSDILCFGRLAVLVPKRAIIQIPPKLADRLKLSPGSQLVSWADFYAANRGWITTVEVSRAQAEGKLDLEKETHERISKCGNLVVATYLTGPISVLPLKAPETTTVQSKP